MGARTKGRMKVMVAGRQFIWYVHADTDLHVASADKKFSIVYPWPWTREQMTVSGQEFPGIDRAEKRPVQILAPHFEYYSLKDLVKRLIRWSFDPEHEIQRL